MNRYHKKKNLFKFFKSKEFNEARMKMCALYIILSYANELHEDVDRLLHGYEGLMIGELKHKSKAASKALDEYDKEYALHIDGGRLIDTDTPYYHFDDAAVWPDHDGMTTLHIVTDPKDVRHWDGKTYHTLYATGLMRSVETFGYGTFTADILLPKGRNLLSAFWLCGDGHWPDSGEIDILEATSDRKGSYFRWLLPSWGTTTNVHYLYERRHKQVKAMRVPWVMQTKNPSERFVKYEAEWRPNAVIFRVNGKVVRTIGWDVTQHFAGQRMNVIFSVKPASEDFTMQTAMMVRNFKYEEL